MRRILLFCLLATLAMSARAGAQTYDVTINAPWMPRTHAVDVTIDSLGGTSGGTCYTDNAPCHYSAAPGATVRISAPASSLAGTPGRLFGGTGPAAACAFSWCRFTATANAAVTVDFDSSRPKATLTGLFGGSGHGSIAVGSGTCADRSYCEIVYLTGTSVLVSATPAAGSRFSRFSTSGGGTACTSSPCTVALTGDTTVTAAFSTLLSIVVSPAAVSRQAGGGEQPFAAVGTFDDGASAVVSPGKGTWFGEPDMTVARFYAAAVAAGGKLYALGGINHVDPFGVSTRLSHVEAYDPVTRAWTGRAAMQRARVACSAVAAGGFIYAIGGDALATVERYDPQTDTWIDRAPLPANRSDMAAATINGIIYAVGGYANRESASTVEAYDPATDTWTPRAPMPTARSGIGVAAVDGILYAVGGFNSTALTTVEAYDPATDTWSTRAPLPVPQSHARATVADGLLYVTGSNGFYAYDRARDTWSVRNPWAAGEPIAALNGVIYQIGGVGGGTAGSLWAFPSVGGFVDSLRWSSTAPAIVPITQEGVARALRPGVAIISATVGRVNCGLACATFTVSMPPTEMWLDGPSNGSTLTATIPFIARGWALNHGALTGTGVDTLHIYAAPASGPAIFLGVATYGLARPDVGAIFGSQFTNSGFSLSAGASLPPGRYTIAVYAHNALTNSFDTVRSADIVLTAPVSGPFMYIDTPTPSAIVTSAFEVGGWAIDAGAPSGTGVDAMAFYVFPDDGAGGGVYMGQGSYGWARGDVGAILGGQFTNCGYHFTITGLGPGQYVVGVYAHSTVTGSYGIVRTVHVTVNATALMSIDTPGAESAFGAQTFAVAGWSIDRAIESTALSGSGVDTLHVYAYPDPGSGQPPIFLGVATVGVSRPDVGAAYGARYATSGYELTIDRTALGLATGVYNIVVHSHSSVSGTFNNVALVRVTLE